MTFCFMQMFFEISGKVRWQIMRGSNLLPKERTRCAGNCCVVHCTTRNNSASLADFENVDDAEVAQLPLEAARVKWFDKAKDLDLPIFGKFRGVFVHVEILRRSGLADLQAGEAVAIRVISGKRGKMAAEVCSGKVFRAIRIWFHLAVGVNDGHCNSRMHRSIVEIKSAHAHIRLNVEVADSARRTRHRSDAPRKHAL